LEKNLFYSNERTAVFIDAYALNKITQNRGIKVDFKHLKTAFAKRSVLSSMHFYTVFDAEIADNPFAKLLDFLAYNGYRVFRKNARVYLDADGKRSIRGTITTELSVDMVAMAKLVDHIVLIGTNVDYVHPVSVVKKQGTRVTVLSCKTSDLI
jgi:uncharacterized LabA/DUF88 family protein